MILHHEKFISNYQNARLLNSRLILKSLIKTDPLRIKIFAFLSKCNHCWIENTILRSNSTLNIKESNMMMRYITLSSLKSLITAPSFLLKHLIHFFTAKRFFQTLRTLFLNTNFLGKRLNHWFLIVIILIKTV
jgi:hypothetical protein